MLTLTNGTDTLYPNAGNKKPTQTGEDLMDEITSIQCTVGIQGEIRLLRNVGNNARLYVMFGQSFPDSEKVLNSLPKKKTTTNGAVNVDT
jgi:hypothetical protein